MKHFKKLLCVVLTLLLIVPGGLAEDMALALNTEETGASFEGDVSSVSANNDDGAAADEDAAFSISSVDSDVAEAGEMDLPADDGDVGTLSVQADYTDAPSASTVTYCFIALDKLVASRTAAEGEEIAAPDAPAAPEGMVFAGWALEDGTAVFADDTPVIARTDPIISEINVIAKFAEAEIPAAPAVFAPSDEDTGSEDGAGAAGDASVSDNTEPVEEPGEGSVPAAADETTPVAADETEPGADDDPEADADAGTDGNGEEGGDADQEDADAAKDGEAVNNADAEKDAEEEGNENAGALEDDPAEGESNGDDASGDDGDEASNEASNEASGEDGGEDGSEDGDEASDEASDEDGGEASGEAEAALQPIRVVFNITPADAVVTVKALDSEAGEAAEEQPDAQPADETPDRTSDNTDASITAQDDGSFALLPGAYTYTASAEGYKPAQDVPFTVAVDALTIDIALEAEAEVSDEESADGAVAEEAQEAQEAEEADGAEEYPPFDQSATCNGVVVSVKADAGTFPAGAALHVSRVLLYEQRQADAAVDEVRDENMTVASSYTFDIKVLDDAGNELQPADGHAVSVSFSVDTVADENLTTTVYHIEEDGGSYTAASLETVEYGDTASAETDGFSVYTVEFAYENKTYSMDGVSQTLRWILDGLGFVGEVTEVTVSNRELFDAVRGEQGEWIIESKQPFSSEEWMKVVIGGQEYKITVTFNWEPVSYTDENGQVKQISEYSLVQSSNEPITWTGWYVLDDNITIPERITVSGEAHLILCPYKTLWAEKGITVAAGNTLNIYAQSTSVGQDVKGVLYSGITKEGTSGTPDYCAGIGGGEGDACGTVTISGGTVKANGTVGGAGIGGGNSGAGGTVTIGGTAQVTANGGDNGAGIGGGWKGDGGTVTIGGTAQVTANGGQYGAGIGGGNDGAGGTVTIGGTAQVTATGGSYGAGIGGGWNGAGGTVTISGGAVTLQTNSTAQPIGHGRDDDSLSPGSLYLSRMHAFILGALGPVEGPAVLNACRNNDNKYVRLERCTEDNPCTYCKYGDIEYAYKDAQGNVFNLLMGSVTPIDNAKYWNSGWYVVENAVTINDRVTVTGTVNLILCDGTDGENVNTLTAAQGITVAEGNTLNIYVGKNGAAKSASDIRGNGALIAGTQGKTPYLRAGIGGDLGAGGTVNIYGGYVKASGGENGAGIGGNIGGAGGTVNIYGGEVLAIGGVNGAGIGGGIGNAGGEVNIYGGKVTAQGGVDGAGIGGGAGGDGGTVTISGGTVIASGGKNGAGIGGGAGGAGGTVTVNGGTVNATGGSGGAGIGGGSIDGIINIVTIGDKITISGGTVTANGGSGGAGIGGGSMVAASRDVSFDGAIEISGGTVTALGGENGAGIGIGSRQGAQGEFNFKGKINIYGGKVDATGGENGAGIGGGYNGDGGTIEISGGVVGAYSNGYGAGIGGGNGGDGGNITISGMANIAKAQGADGGAGIGGGNGGDGGTITVNGGTVYATGNGGAGKGGAGIGGGDGGAGGTITISGGTVNATGGINGGAGIGGGYQGAGGNITISGKANVTTQGAGGGAGIGGGYQRDGGTITISGKANVTTQGGTGGAGIGGGYQRDGGTITISGGTVEATGGLYGAGIGGGYQGAGGNITIEGTANITNAQGGTGGAGIGGGYQRDGGKVTISDGEVTATGGENGAGIGGGYLGAGGNITIEGTANITNAQGGTGGAGIGSGDGGKNGSITIDGGTVTATGGECGAGIGGGRYGQIESITIEGGTIEANGGLYAAGIGGGMAGKGDGYRVHGGTIKISDGTVNATGGEKGAGIGGGWEGAGGNITIEGGTVTAIGGTMGAGIGSGYLCQFGPSSVTISGGTVTANGGSGGAGIGAGMDSLKAGIALSYSATGGVPELPKITSSSYVGDVTMSGDFCEWLDAGHYGVVFDAENANVDLYKEAMAGLTIVPCPAGAHRIDVQLLPGYGGGAPRNRAFAAMKTKTGKEIPVSKAFGGSSIALHLEAAPGCEIEYRPSRLTGSDGREIHLDRNDAFIMPDCDVSAYLTRWAWLQWAIDRAANAEGSPSLTLTADVRAEKWEKALAVPKGRPVTIDLAGCSIDRNLNNAAENGGVIDVTGALTVKDGSQSRTGKITGGYTVGNGGGAYVHGGGALTLTGSAVTGNRAAQGGGVYVADGSFSVSGAPKITGNTCNGAANNVYLPRGAVIDVAGGLESGATIGVTTASNPETDGAVTLTRGLNGRGAPTAFASDEGYNVAWSSDGQEAVLPAQETILPAKLKAYGKTSLRLSWNAVDGAEGYDVFFALCGSNTYRLAGTVTDRLSYRFRKLNRHTCYKAYVCAWRTVDGVKTYTGVESLRLHAVTGGYAHKITNPKKVTVKRKAVKLAPGGKVRMGAKVTGVRSGKKVLSHVNRLRYYSTNPTVATVDEKGRITAVNFGECTVYAVANNGIRKGTRVTVREKTVKTGKK